MPSGQAAPSSGQPAVLSSAGPEPLPQPAIPPQSPNRRCRPDEPSHAPCREMRHPDNGLAGVRVPLGELRSIDHTLKADERKMAEWRHRPVLDQPYSTMTLSPVGQPAKTKFRTPAKFPGYRRETDFKGATRPTLSADVIDEHDLAAGPDHAHEFIERSFRFWHGGDDKLRDHDVKRAIGQSHPLGIHHRQRFDIAEPVLDNTLMRFAQHRFRQIDPHQPVLPRVVRKRNAGADAHFEDASPTRPACVLSRHDGSASTYVKDCAEHKVVDRRPARISALNA